MVLKKTYNSTTEVTLNFKEEKDSVTLEEVPQLLEISNSVQEGALITPNYC